MQLIIMLLNVHYTLVILKVTDMNEPLTNYVYIKSYLIYIAQKIYPFGSRLLPSKDISTVISQISTAHYCRAHSVGDLNA
jgi:hypothetical protein